VIVQEVGVESDNDGGIIGSCVACLNAMVMIVEEVNSMSRRGISGLYKELL
jgi:hypothetical protein